MYICIYVYMYMYICIYVYVYVCMYTRPLRGLVWYSAFAAVPPTRALRSRYASHRVCIFCITSNRIHCVDIDPTWKRKVLCRAEYSPCWASRGANLAPIWGTWINLATIKLKWRTIWYTYTFICRPSHHIHFYFDSKYHLNRDAVLQAKLESNGTCI